MLKQVADGVFVHESEFIHTHTTVVRGPDGVLLVDPGITRAEMAELAEDLRRLGSPVVAAFSTHPHWDHALWHPDLGKAPRYATARGAAIIRDLLAQPGWEAVIAEGLPPEYADDIPMELLGALSALPEGAAVLPWNGPTARIVEHRGHETGHAALLLEETGVLVAGDMLSDILMPFLDMSAADPLGDYAAALELFEGIAAEVAVVIPGHGSVGDAAQFRARLAADRAYIRALQDGRDPDDIRVGSEAPLYWLPEVHRWQVEAMERKASE